MLHWHNEYWVGRKVPHAELKVIPSNKGQAMKLAPKMNVRCKLFHKLQTFCAGFLYLMWCCHYPRYVHPWEIETMQTCVLGLFLWEFCFFFLCGWSKHLHNYAGPKELCHGFMPVLSGQSRPHKCLNVEPGGCTWSSASPGCTGGVWL